MSSFISIAVNSVDETDTATDHGTGSRVLVTLFQNIDLAIGIATHDDSTDDLEVGSLGALERFEVCLGRRGIRVGRYVQREVVTDHVLLF